MGFAKKHYPLIVALLAFWIVTAIFLDISISQTDGHLIYYLDDTYIHMAIAKNFAIHKVWGVTKYEFSSSSSSPLWTLILSLAYILFGVNELAPFVLCLLFGTAFIFCSYLIFKRLNLSSSVSLALLILLIFFTPLVPLVFCGLEPILQMLIDIAFVYLCARILSGEKLTSVQRVLLFMLASATTAVRYEGMFLVFVVGVLFVLNRRFLDAVLLAVFAAIPICIIGVISILKGWYFLPNPVLIKGYTPRPFSLSGLVELVKVSEKMLSIGYHVTFLVLASLFILYAQLSNKNRVWQLDTVINVVFIATALLHLQFVGANIRFFRYESYLIALWIFGVGIWLNKLLPIQLSLKNRKDTISRYIALATLAFIVLFPISWRAIRAIRTIPKAAKNIYEQQYQMGLFFKKFYEGEAVAVNDIGAVNFLADVKCVDLWGLANLKVGELRRKRQYTSQKIDEITKERGVKVAIVYDDWFTKDLPTVKNLPLRWVKVGSWQVKKNFMLGGDTVSIYAVDPSEVQNLISNLKAFAQYLPKDVIQKGEYVK